MTNAFDLDDQIRLSGLGVVVADEPPPAPPAVMTEEEALRLRAHAAYWEAEAVRWRDRSSTAENLVRRLSEMSVQERKQLVQAACARDAQSRAKKWFYLAVGAGVGAVGAVIGVGCVLAAFGR